MTTPVIPVTAGTPVDDVPAGVLGRISYKVPVIYGVLATLSLVGLAGTLLRRPDGWSQQTNFQFRYGDQWFTLPNFTVPALVSILVLSAVMVGAAAYSLARTRGRATVPMWLHVVVGLSFVLAFLTWAGAGKVTAVIPLTSLLAGALALSVPLIFGAMSGVICERSGVINIAIEGQLLFGAFAAAVIASYFATPYLGLVAAPIAGAMIGALLAWFAVMYKVNQIIIGVVLNTLVLGLTSFFFSTVLADNREVWNARQPLGVIEIPLLSQIPIIGPVLFRQSILVYLMYIAVIVLQVMLFRSRWGLRTRAVGEHPKAADTVGINVNKRRVGNVILGGAVAGLGGAFFTVGSGLAFGREMSAGNGFIALAAMILGKWNPAGAVVAALLFGFSKNLGNVLSSIGSPMPSQLLLMLPYVITIFAVAGLVGRVRPPAANGVPYTK